MYGNNAIMRDKILADSSIAKHMEIATIADIGPLLQINIFSFTLLKHVFSTLVTQPCGELTQ